MTVFFSSPQTVFAQPVTTLQYQFQPNQTLCYRLELQHELKTPGGTGQAGQASPPERVGQDMPVITKITFQASVRMVEVDSVGVATLEARAEQFSVKNTIGSKYTVLPVSATGQTVQFRVGLSGLLSGQPARSSKTAPNSGELRRPGEESLSGSSVLPWNLFLSQIFPDLTRCRYLSPAVFNGKPCAKIEIGLNQGKGVGLFAKGHLISGETQGSVDLGYSAKGTFSSRLSLLP